jgi:N-acetylmuramoyl-L-alanine amidase
MKMAKVAGNAGHCPGQDSGAVGPTGLQEADVAKDITEKVLSFVAAVGHETKFIQENELEDICRISNEWGADLFVSIHCNSAENPEANGMEIFTSKGQTYADPLATCIMNQLASSEPTSALNVRADYVDGDVDKEANFYVVRYTDAPATLVEVAFISNPSEEAMLADSEQRTKIAASIARGITDYLQSIA